MKKLSKAEEQMVKDLDRLQSSLISASPSITRSNVIGTRNDYKQMLTFRSNDNKSLYVLIFGIFGIIAIIYISLATATATSFISSSSNERHLLIDTAQGANVATAGQNLPQQMMSKQDPVPIQQANTEAINPKITAKPEDITAAEAILAQLYKDLKLAPVKDRALAVLLCAVIGDALGGPLEFHFGPGRAMTQPMVVGKMVGGQWFPTKTLRIAIQAGQFSDPVLVDNAVGIYKAAVIKAMEESGGGVHKLAKWQTTDDTAMAIQMTKGLIEASKPENKVNGQISVKRIQQEIANKYWEWANPNPTGDAKTARDRVINSAPFDIGITIKKILQSATLKRNPGDPVDIAELLKVSAAVNDDSKRLNRGSGTFSNGALMRIFPMAVFCKDLTADKVFEVVKADVQLTNNNIASARLVTTYVLIMRELILGKTAEQALNYGIQYLDGTASKETEEVIAFEKDSTNPSTVYKKWIEEHQKNKYGKEGCRFSDPPFCTLGNDGTMGLLDIPFKQTIYYLSKLREKGFVTSMKEVLEGGGDTDTNAAIVGAMLGANLGFRRIYELPQGKQWLIGLLTSKVEEHPEVNKDDKVYPDFNPYLARKFIDEKLWEQLFEIAPSNTRIAMDIS